MTITASPQSQDNQKPGRDPQDGATPSRADTVASAASARPIDRVLSRLECVRRAGDGWLALCTAHEDSHASLSVKETADGTVLMKCRVGCATADIVRNAGLAWIDLFPSGSRERRRPRTWGGIVPITGRGRPALESFGDPVTANMLAELARLAYVRGQLHGHVARALRVVAAAVEVSDERLREAVREAIDIENQP